MKVKLMVNLVFAFTLGVLYGLPAFAQNLQCSQNCQVSAPGEQDILDAINDLVDSALLPATVERDPETGVATVTFADGSMFSLSTIGLSLRHQSMQQRRVQQSEDGSLQLRTTAGLEIRLRAAIHRESDAIAEMFRLGWSDFFWFDNGIETTTAAGDRLCLAPDMDLDSGTVPQQTSVSFDSDGNVVVIYSDGIQQRLHACPHDFIQLRDHVRSATQQQLNLDPYGVFILDVDGVATQFRLSATLRQTNTLDNPGFYMDSDRIYFRYRDGWEQEIVPLS